MTSTLEITPRGPFSLRAAAGFGFGPTEGGGRPFEDGVLRYAFAADGGGYAGVELRQETDDAAVIATVHGDGDAAAVQAQIERVLSLDHDGERFLAVGERDSVIGELQRAHPGQRPVLFFSPYEAAAWAVISARQRGVPAATVRASLAESLGESFDLAGATEPAFPQPQRLLEGSIAVPGLNAEKQLRLRGVAEAALAGDLDPERLHALGPEDAYADLQRLRGIGPFYAGRIVLRACGFADAPLVIAEPKVLAHAARFYGLPDVPDMSRFAELADTWRPFRTWCTVLLRLGGDRAKE